MPVLLQVLYANGIGEMPPGSYLYTFDIEAHDGRGAFDVTQDRSKAAQFADMTQAFETWRSVPKSRPIRDDGAPNRPLTALSISFVQTDAEGEPISATARHTNPYSQPTMPEPRRKMPQPSKDYRVGICKTDSNETVTFEGDFTVTVHCDARGRAQRNPSLSAAGRPSEEPEFSIEAIYDESAGRYIDEKHQLWDELEEKALELCDNDTSFWWS